MQARRVGALALIFLSVLIESSIVLAQRPARGRGTDAITHRFRPAISPDLINLDASGAIVQSEAAIGPSAAQQIHALLLDKQTRTPAQNKISSKLLYTARMLRGLAAAPGVPSLATGVDVDNDGNVMVDIAADVTDDLLARLKEQGATIYSYYPASRAVRALLPAARLEDIAAWPDVIFIAPRQEAMTARYEAAAPEYVSVSSRTNFALRSARVSEFLVGRLGPARIIRPAGTSLAPTGQGSQTSEGDLTHRAFDARMAFGVNGAGIKIGVLSDGASSLAASQALGDLPPNVTVLPGQLGGGDEGTAMMEIVHDLAPGAQLYFATAFNGVASFAQNIRDLRATGCDIIIDDVFYFDENPFVDGQTAAVVSLSNGGLILQAVNDVTAEGALYFSSAGNEGNLDSASAGAYESDFVDGGSLGLLAGGTVHLFGTTQYDAISANGGNYVELFWSDPLGASNNDYDLFVLNSTGTAVLEASTDVQDGTQDPVESLSPTYNVAGNRLVVFKHAGAHNRYFHLNTFRGGLSLASAGETHGHSHAANAYSVAATPALRAWSPVTAGGPFPNPFSAANQIELFSSDGPRHLFYHADGTAITPGDLSSTGGMVRQKPDLTAADGVSVTGVGGFGSPFYGTSAAAPHAGAIAALLKSASPTASAGELRSALTTSAVDIMRPGSDRDSGAGIVMAFEALVALGVAGAANPELGAVTASDHPGNGNGLVEAGEGGIVNVELKNTGGVVDATGISASLTTTTAGVTVTQPGVSAYANLPRLSGSGNNLSPFTFTLATDYPCGQPIDFVLSVAYTGGPSPRALRFTIPTGPVFNLSTVLNTNAPPSPLAGVVAATGTQAGRVLRNGVPASCGTTPKPWPGAFDASLRQYHSYLFTATQDACTVFTLTATSGVNLFLNAYSPAFNPGDLLTNFYADSGTSSSVQSFAMAIAAGQSYVVTVHDVPSGAASGTSYNLQFSECAIAITGSNHAPVALAHDVKAVADSAHTASASIDNGSYDPDAGDTITLTQTPAGPYAIGATSVLLTVADRLGATAQASATVTVVDSNFDFGGQALPAKTVTAGGSIMQTITIRPNPAPWNSVVTFTCSGLPALTTCTFNPATLIPGSSDATSTLTVATTARRTALLRIDVAAELAVSFFGLGLFTLASGRWRRKRSVRKLFAMLLFGIVSFGFSNCGGRAATAGGTPAGIYVITVTAASGGVGHVAGFQLTVN